jgi:hypothetical protein
MSEQNQTEKIKHMVKKSKDLKEAGWRRTSALQDVDPQSSVSL